MTGLIWSFVLSGIGIVGIILAGSKFKLGWLIGFFVQPLWIVFAVTTGQYGFILNAVIYATVYARNWLKWRREESGAQRPAKLSELPSGGLHPDDPRSGERLGSASAMTDYRLTPHERRMAEAVIAGKPLMMFNGRRMGKQRAIVDTVSARTGLEASTVLDLFRHGWLYTESLTTNSGQWNRDLRS